MLWATFLAKTLDSWYCSHKCSQKAYDWKGLSTLTPLGK